MMTILNIVTYPNNILIKVADNIESINKNIKSTLANMVDTMEYANGIGLAAPQIGISLRMFVMHTRDDKIIKCINPRIVKRSKKLHTMQEGCLSIPGFLADISRSWEVTMEFMDTAANIKKITLNDIDASCAQHEIDHLDGILINHKAQS